MSKEYEKRVVVQAIYEAAPQETLLEEFDTVAAWQATGDFGPVITSITTNEFSGQHCAKIVCTGIGVGGNGYITRFAPYVKQRYINFEFSLGFEGNAQLVDFFKIGQSTGTTHKYTDIKISAINTTTLTIAIYNTATLVYDTLGTIDLGGSVGTKQFITISGQIDLITGKYVLLKVGDKTFSVSAYNLKSEQNIQDFRATGIFEVKTPSIALATTGTYYLDRLVFWGSMT